MNWDLIITTLLATMTGLAMTRWSLMPNWYYRLFRIKPFTCTTCLSFWCGVLLTIFFTEAHWLLALPVGLSAAALTVITINLTE